MRTQPTSFHPDQLIPLVYAQHPDRKDVIRALQLCNAGQWESPVSMYFVSNKDANLPGSEWQLQENVIVATEDKGSVVLNVLKDGRIGRIEFVQH